MTFDLDDNYIRDHLGYELTCLLVAATTWVAARATDSERLPVRLVDLAQDSAFMHARVLYEFMTREPNSGWEKSRTPHEPLTSVLWDAFSGPMHEKALHPSPRRPYAPVPGRLADELADRVQDFADDVLRLWDLLSVQPSMNPHRAAMDAARTSAVKEATMAADRLRINPIFGN